jgi:hypothetical protein
MPADPPEQPVARQGLVVDDADPVRLRHAIEMAFEYRGDVTITCRDLPRPIQGYVFDRRDGATPRDSALRLIPGDGSPRVSIAYDRIRRIEFSGRDTAEGKSFQTWMRHYLERKLAGQAANLHPDDA